MILFDLVIRSCDSIESFKRVFSIEWVPQLVACTWLQKSFLCGPEQWQGVPLFANPTQRWSDPNPAQQKQFYCHPAKNIRNQVCTKPTDQSSDPSIARKMQSCCQATRPWTGRTEIKGLQGETSTLWKLSKAHIQLFLQDQIYVTQVQMQALKSTF